MTAGKSCVMLRASDYPPNKKNQTAQAFRKFRDGGGRQFLVPIPEWERMMMVREFHAHHKNDPGFAAWFESSKLLSNLISIIQLLRLDLLGRTIPGKVREVVPIAEVSKSYTAGEIDAETRHDAFVAGTTLGKDTVEPQPANDDELPLSVILDETGANGTSILAGRGNRRPLEACVAQHECA